MSLLRLVEYLDFRDLKELLGCFVSATTLEGNQIEGVFVKFTDFGDPLIKMMNNEEHPCKPESLQRFQDQDLRPDVVRFVYDLGVPVLQSYLAYLREHEEKL